MSPKPRRWAKPQDAAEYLGVTIRTLQNMQSDGRITAYRLGAGTVRYDLNQIDDALEASA